MYSMLLEEISLCLIIRQTENVALQSVLTSMEKNVQKSLIRILLLQAAHFQDTFIQVTVVMILLVNQALMSFKTILRTQ